MEEKKKSDVNDLPVSHFGAYPGYWTENIFLHDWPPNWEPANDWGKDQVAASMAGVAGRQKQLEAGIDGSLHGLSAKTDAAIEAYRARMKGGMR